jgi:hypothetical protein
MSGVGDDKRYAYLTRSDARNIRHYKNSKLLLVKAPPNTQLTVSPLMEGLQMHMKSDGEAFYAYIKRVPCACRAAVIVVAGVRRNRKVSLQTSNLLTKTKKVAPGSGSLAQKT